jgi:hypothetical protein
MRSPIYWNPKIYTFALRALYGNELDKRWEVIKPLVGPNDRVLDLCCGDGEVRHHLPKTIHYMPADANRTFISHFAREGYDARVVDVRHDAFPEADTVLLMGALCHIYPGHEAVIEKAKRAAKKRLIVVEPHVNWASRSGLLGRLAKVLSDPGVSGAHLGRLNRSQLEDIATRTNPTQVVRLEREYVFSYDK